MLKVENLRTFNWEGALRGMRNPYNSYAKSDSTFDENGNVINIGENDLRLMKTLFKAGTEHRKYLRQIFVSMDITAPLYLWKEADTYKIGTTSNSCSTMHKIQSQEFTEDMFSCEHLNSDSMATLRSTIFQLNKYRKLYNENHNKNDWWQMIQLLPSSYNQRRTITMNYENVFTIIHQRSGHRLTEWNELIEVFKTLPYVQELLSALDEKEIKQ